MKLWILAASVSVIVTTACTSTHNIDAELTVKGLARVNNTTADDPSNYHTQKVHLLKVDGDIVAYDLRHKFHHVKAGKRQLTGRCIIRFSSLQSYVKEETIAANLVKGRTYKLGLEVKPETSSSKATCGLTIKDITQ